MTTLFSSLVGSQAAMIDYKVKSALSEGKEYCPPLRHNFCFIPKQLSMALFSLRQEKFREERR